MLAGRCAIVTVAALGGFEAVRLCLLGSGGGQAAPLVLPSQVLLRHSLLHTRQHEMKCWWVNTRVPWVQGPELRRHCCIPSPPGRSISPPPTRPPAGSAPAPPPAPPAAPGRQGGGGSGRAGGGHAPGGRAPVRKEEGSRVHLPDGLGAAPRWPHAAAFYVHPSPAPPLPAAPPRPAHTFARGSRRPPMEARGRRLMLTDGPWGLPMMPSALPRRLGPLHNGEGVQHASLMEDGHLHALRYCSLSMHVQRAAGSHAVVTQHLLSSATCSTWRRVSKAQPRQLSGAHPQRVERCLQPRGKAVGAVCQMCVGPGRRAAPGSSITGCQRLMKHAGPAAGHTLPAAAPRRRQSGRWPAGPSPAGAAARPTRPAGPGTTRGSQTLAQHRAQRGEEDSRRLSRQPKRGRRWSCCAMRPRAASPALASPPGPPAHPPTCAHARRIIIHACRPKPLQHLVAWLARGGGTNVNRLLPARWLKPYGSVPRWDPPLASTSAHMHCLALAPFSGAPSRTSRHSTHPPTHPPTHHPPRR